MDDGTGKDDLVADLPWPKPRPALLGPHGDWSNNAVLNRMTGEEWWVYAEGYARGAEILVRHVVDGNRDLDFLVYPIVFLYRHHLELALKDLIRGAGDLLGKRRKSLWAARSRKTSYLRVMFREEIVEGFQLYRVFPYLFKVLQVFKVFKSFEDLSINLNVEDDGDGFTVADHELWRLRKHFIPSGIYDWTQTQRVVSPSIIT